jgi:hypothetical protein
MRLQRGKFLVYNLNDLGTDCLEGPSDPPMGVTWAHQE